MVALCEIFRIYTKFLTGVVIVSSCFGSYNVKISWCSRPVTHRIHFHSKWSGPVALKIPDEISKTISPLTLKIHQHCNFTMLCMLNGSFSNVYINQSHKNVLNYLIVTFYFVITKITNVLVFFYKNFVLPLNN